MTRSRGRGALVSLVAAAMAILAAPPMARAQELAYVLARKANAVSIIDADSGTLKRTVSFAADELSDLRDIVVAPDGALAFISAFEQVGVFDTVANRLVAKIPVPRGCSPGRLAMAPDGNELWAGDDEDCRNIWIIDPHLHRITQTLSLTPEDYQGVGAITFIPGTAAVVGITNGYTDYFVADVFSIDSATHQLRERLPLTSSLITDAAASLDGHFTYLAIGYSPSRLVIMDNLSFTVVDTIGLPSYVRGFAVSRDGSRVYAASSTDTTDMTQSDTAVSVVDTSSRAVRRLASLSGRAGRIALTHDSGSLLVPLADAQGSVVRIDAATGAMTGSTPAGQEPVTIALSRAPSSRGTVTDSDGCAIAGHAGSGVVGISPFLVLVFICARALFARSSLP